MRRVEQSGSKLHDIIKNKESSAPLRSTFFVRVNPPLEAWEAEPGGGGGGGGGDGGDAFLPRRDASPPEDFQGGRFLDEKTLYLVS